MSRVKLRINMILDSQFVKFGTIVDEDKIPPHLMKKKYILRPGEIDYDAKNLALQEEAVQELDVEELSEDDGEEDKDKPPTKIQVANKRAVRR